MTKGTRITASKVDTFKKWLQAGGAEVQPTTNEYELFRFRCAHGVGVIYTGRRGISVNADFVLQAFEKFSAGQPWRGFLPKTRRQKKRGEKDRLIDRDGPACFYCGELFEPPDLTIEHLLSVSHGGPNRLENKALACAPCNQKADNMPLIDKVRLREQMRA